MPGCCADGDSRLAKLILVVPMTPSQHPSEARGGNSATFIGSIYKMPSGKGFWAGGSWRLPTGAQTPRPDNRGIAQLRRFMEGRGRESWRRVCKVSGSKRQAHHPVAIQEVCRGEVASVLGSTVKVRVPGQSQGSVGMEQPRAATGWLCQGWQGRPPSLLLLAGSTPGHGSH